jgi:hypothetical protein
VLSDFLLFTSPSIPIILQPKFESNEFARNDFFLSVVKYVIEEPKSTTMIFLVPYLLGSDMLYDVLKHEVCTILVYYKLSSSKYVPTLWHNLSVALSGIRNSKRSPSFLFGYRDPCGRGLIGSPEM